ncbi:MAG: GxxExxY protein [Rhodothermales bacterium]|jgi:GxxExxY protein
MVVDNKAVYELKTVKALDKHHTAQLMNYLLLLDLQRGKLINLSVFQKWDNLNPLF